MVMVWEIKDHMDLDAHRPVARGGFRVILMIAIAVGGMLLAVKSGFIHGLSEKISPYVILALVCYYGAMRFIAYGSVSRFFKEWWQRNVAGRIALYREREGTRDIRVVSRSSLGTLGENMLAIPLGGWWPKSVISVGAVLPHRWKLRFSLNRTRRTHPDCIDMIDHYGSRVVFTDAWEVLALLNSVHDVWDWWRVIEKLSERAKFTRELLISLLDQTAEMILQTSRLKDSMEGHRVLTFLAANLAQLLPEADERKDKYERISHEPDPLSRPRRTPRPAPPAEGGG